MKRIYPLFPCGVKRKSLPFVFTIIFLFSGISSANAQYCKVQTNCEYGYEIYNFYTTGAYQNIPSINSGCLLSGYRDRTGSDTLITSPDSTFTFSFDGNSGSSPQGAAIWIDLNGDGDFQDADEMVWTSNSLDTVFSGSIHIPDTVPQGYTRIRIMTDHQCIPSDPCNPCNTYSRGSVMDITLLISETPSCLPPYDLSFTSGNGPEVLLDWKSDGSAVSWEGEWDDYGFSQGTGNTFTTASRPYLLTGLSEMTPYTYYVRSVCATGVSPWSTIGTFSSAYQQAQCSTGVWGALFREEWGSGTDAWSRDVGTNPGQWQAGSNDSVVSETGPQQAHSGKRYIYYDASGGSPGSASLLSPSIDLSSASQKTVLSFWLHAFGYDIPGASLTIGASPNPYGPFDTLYQKTFVAPVQHFQSDPFIRQYADLSKYTGQVIYVNITYDTPGGEKGNLAIDDIRISSCVSCASPSGFSAYSITDKTVGLSWSDTGTGTQWQVQYDTTGFKTGTGKWQEGPSPHTISGLTPLTSYDFYLRSICSAGDTSVWAGPLTVNTTDCPQGGFCFSNAGANGATGPSQSQVDSAYAGTSLDGQVQIVNGYQQWIVPDTAIYDVTLYGAEGGGARASHRGQGGKTSGMLLLNAGDTLYVAVGQAGMLGHRLSNPPEGGFNGGGGGGGSPNGFHGSSGGGASDLRLGDTTLDNRIMVAAGGGGGTGNADTIWISSGGGGGGGGYYGGGGGHGSHQSPYKAGKGGTQSAGGTGGGTLYGNTAGQKGSGGQGGHTDYSNVSSDEKNIHGGDGGGLTGLPGHFKKYSAMGSAGGGGSSFSEGISQCQVSQGNTKAGVKKGHGSVALQPLSQTCIFPKQLTTSNITGDSASLSWTDMSGATEWEIQYGIKGFALGEGTSRLVNNKPSIVDGLVAGVTYDWYVRAICGAGDTSLWAGPQNFNTISCASHQYCFSNAGQTGPFGPSQQQLSATYTGTNLQGQVTGDSGIQQWAVPDTGYYRIETAGAKGGGIGGGNGAKISGVFEFNAGDTLRILVGQKGETDVSAQKTHAGGGGSFVATATNKPLIVAGGGGGATKDFAISGNIHASVNSRGNDGVGPLYGNGGTDGNGGSFPSENNSGYPYAYSAGGGGFYGDGENIPQTANPKHGLAFVNGGQGNGGSVSGNEDASGGFGGGAGATSKSSNPRQSHGGGGGYSGGGAGGDHSYANECAGGGGGSFNAGYEQENTGEINPGHGFVHITPLSPPTCMHPANLTANNITAGSAVLQWDEQGSATQWQVKYRRENQTAEQENDVIVDSIGLKVDNLWAFTSYQYYVRSICSPGDTSFWEGPYRFMTEKCSPPSYCFTNAGATGAKGPKASEIAAEYAGTPLDGLVSPVNGYQRLVIPQSGEYRITALGAEGGGANSKHRGQGGLARGTVTLLAGDTVFVAVGQAGQYGHNQTPPPRGGFNGGGDGGVPVLFRSGSSGGGGSDVRIGDTTLNKRVIVAGGGGGGTGNSSHSYVHSGGGGGGGGYYGGGAGEGGKLKMWVTPVPGQGGTQLTGGSGGGNPGDYTYGTSGKGGKGDSSEVTPGTYVYKSDINARGGHGGGAKGKAGDFDDNQFLSQSPAMGGGGGSAYVGGISQYPLNNTKMQSGINTGHGLVAMEKPPDIPAPSIKDMCIDEEPVKLTAPVSKGGSFSGPGISEDTLYPQKAGTGAHNIKYTYTAENGLKGFTQTTVEIHPLPQISAFANPDTANYMNTISLNVNVGGGAYTYAWSPADSLENPTDTSSKNPMSKKMISPTTFDVIVTDSSTGCAAKDSIRIPVVGGSLNVRASALKDTVCPKDTTTLEAIVYGGSGNYNYSWTSTPPGFSANSKNPVVIPTQSTTYILKVDDGTQTVTDSVNLLVWNTPDINISTMNGPDYVECTPEDTLMGSPDGGTFSGTTVNNNIFKPQIAGPGAHHIHYEYTDSNNCFITDSTVLNVYPDTIAPTVFAKDTQVYLNNNGMAVLNANDLDNGSSDNCEITDMFLTKSTFSCADTGVNTVALKAGDAKGNYSQAAAQVTVLDTTAPFVLTKNITVYLDTSGQVTISPQQIDNGSWDNCTMENQSLDTTTFDCSKLGANTITLTVTDVNQNSATATAQVTVKDTLPPQLKTQNVQLSLDTNGEATLDVSQIDNGSTDNCAIDSLMLSKSLFNCNDTGSNTVYLKSFDASQNTDSTAATVTVSDTLPPVTQVKNPDVFLDSAGTASISITDIDNGSWDNCGIDYQQLDTDSFNCQDTGLQIITLTTVDMNNNSSQATAQINVYDTIAPTASARDITVYLDPNGEAIISPAQIDTGSWDNCGIDSIMLDQTTFNCADTGLNTVTLTVVDVKGNVAAEDAQVTVMDTLPPWLLIQPENVFLDSAGQASLSVADVNKGTADNCGIDSLWLNKHDFGCNDLGSNMIIFSAVDYSGNIVSDTLQIMVLDTLKPLFIPVNDTTICPGVFSFDMPGAMDNCPISVVQTAGPSSGDFLQAGKYTLEFLTTDQAGNSSSMHYNVFVSQPIVDLGPDTTLKPEDTIVLHVDTGYSQYLWSTGDTTPAIMVDSTVQNTQNIWVTVTDSIGCTNSDSITILFTTGISLIDNKGSVTIRPNPNKGSFDLKLKGLPDQHLEICIYSLAGRKIQCQNKIKNPKDKLHIPFDLSRESAGIYLIRITGEKTRMVKRVIIQQ